MQSEFEGVVLFNRPHRENDGLVKIFTREYGAKMFFVRAFKRPNHPLNNQLQALTCNKYIGKINHDGLSFLQEASTISMFYNIHLNLEVQAHAAYIAQLVDAAIEDEEVSEKLYETFKNALVALNSNIPCRIVTLYMEVFLLDYFGVGLDFLHCAVCGESGQPFDVSINRNGVLCPKHYHLDQFRLHAHPRAAYVLGLLSQLEISQINKVSLSDELYSQMRRIMDEIYNEYIGLRLKSKSFLDQFYTDEVPEKYRIKRRP